MAQARIFLLVDLREFFFRFRVGGTKKKKLKCSENDQLTGHFQSIFFFFSLSFLQKNSKTSKVIFIYFIIFLKIWKGQSLLTVSLSKMHRQNKQLIFRVGV